MYFSLTGIRIRDTVQVMPLVLPLPLSLTLTLRHNRPFNNAAIFIYSCSSSSSCFISTLQLIILHTHTHSYDMTPIISLTPEKQFLGISIINYVSLLAVYPKQNALINKIITSGSTAV